ncbi:MAG: hypothetical protein WDM71_03395 [Ferruginibacter sp.]
MGDTGSLLLGLINSILVIKFINIADSSAIKFPLESVVALGFSILIVPLFDTLRVFGIRILNRRSPFSPDRNHVHHFLLDLGFSHRRIAITCVLANICLVAIAFLIRDLGTTMVMAVLLLVASLFTAIIYFSRKNKQALEDVPVEKEFIKSHKILTLSPKVIETE